MYKCISIYFKPVLLKSQLYFLKTLQKLSPGTVFFLLILVILIYALPFSHMPSDPGYTLEKDFSAQAYVGRLVFLRVNILTYLSLLAGFPLGK